MFEKKLINKIIFITINSFEKNKHTRFMHIFLRITYNSAVGPDVCNDTYQVLNTKIFFYQI